MDSADTLAERARILEFVSRLRHSLTEKSLNEMLFAIKKGKTVHELAEMHGWPWTYREHESE